MNGAPEIPGWSVPLHRSLTEPILLGGVPRGMAIGLGLQLWIAGIAVYLLGHAAALFLTRQDPLFGPMFARHLRAARRHLDV